MNRYRNITKASTSDRKKIYRNIKYPEIPLSSEDTYIYTTVGDSYDSLALTFYKNSSYWWVIASANPEQSLDTLYPTPGTQIRIPNNLSEVLSSYENLNSF